MVTAKANFADPDQTTQNATSDQSLLFADSLASIL